MRWFEYSYVCQCGDSEEGFVPSNERLNLRCYTCFRYQQPKLYRLHIDDIDYNDYLDEMFEVEEEPDEEVWVE